MPASRNTPDGREEVAEDSRRARKRATDRRAQRDHRQRRKAYVQQLEDSLRSLTEQHSTEERVQALLEENKRLREEVNGLRLKLSQIHTISAIAKPGNEESSQSPDNDSSNDDVHEAEAIAHDGLENIDHVASMTDLDWTDIATSVAPQVDFLFDTQVTRTYPPPADEVFVDSQAHIDCTGSAADINSLVPLNQGHPELRSEPPYPTWNDAPLPQIDTMPSFSLAGRPDYLCFPRYCNPVGPADKAMAQFIKEAREEHMNSRFDDSEPCLSRLLSNPPHTILAFRLFHFITRAGPMPLHLFMGIFWLQYLVLRWMVLGTQAAYKRIPEFLRPSNLECLIPHRPFVSMIAWPDIRQALIRDGDQGDPEATGTQMLKHLTHKWTGPNGAASGMVGSMNVADIIEKQSEQTSFWTLDKEFFDIFPQYSECRLPADALPAVT